MVGEVHVIITRLLWSHHIPHFLLNKIIFRVADMGVQTNKTKPDGWSCIRDLSDASQVDCKLIKPWKLIKGMSQEEDRYSQILSCLLNSKVISYKPDAGNEDKDNIRVQRNQGLDSRNRPSKQ